MKLPIRLNVHGDSIWSSYREERNACNDIPSLQAFVQRWGTIYPFKVEQIVINEDVLAAVKSEKVGDQDMVAVNIILPVKILQAMQIASERVVPLNTAFIQANGGLGEFEV